MFYVSQTWLMCLELVFFLLVYLYTIIAILYQFLPLGCPVVLLLLTPCLHAVFACFVSAKLNQILCLTHCFAEIPF